MSYDTKEYLGWLLSSLACALIVLAHQYTPRHEFHAVPDTLLMAVGFFIVIYTKDRYYLGKKLLHSLPLRLSAAYLVVHHLAMFAGPAAEVVVAAIFCLGLVLCVAYLWLKGLFEVILDD